MFERLNRHSTTKPKSPQQPPTTGISHFPSSSSGTRTLVRAGILLRLLVVTGSSFCGDVLDRFDFLTIDASISGSASESTMMMGASLRFFEVELEVEGVGLEVEGTGFMLEGVNFKLEKVSFEVCETAFELEEAGSTIRFFEKVESTTVSAARRRFFCFFSLVSYTPIISIMSIPMNERGDLQGQQPHDLQWTASSASWS